MRLFFKNHKLTNPLISFSIYAFSFSLFVFSINTLFASRGSIPESIDLAKPVYVSTYKVVYGNNLGELEKRVELELRSGWSLQGGVSEVRGAWFCQAMVRFR